MSFAAILPEVDQCRAVSPPLERPTGSDTELAKKGRLYERNQYFLRSADRAVHDPAASLDAQTETTDHRVSIAKDVPVLRIDHISTKSPLLGVWRGQRSRAVVRQCRAAVQR
jgi:hypothetical protein